MKALKTMMRAVLLIGIALTTTSCDPQVYGSVGISSWGGSGPRLGGNISLGGCLTCR